MRGPRQLLSQARDLGARWGRRWDEERDGWLSCPLVDQMHCPWVLEQLYPKPHWEPNILRKCAPGCWGFDSATSGGLLPKWLHQVTLRTTHMEKEQGVQCVTMCLMDASV